MLPRHPQTKTKPKRRVPIRWLMCDARLGDGIPAIVAAMPPRSAVVVRPYAMCAEGRSEVIRQVRNIARAKRHLLLLAGPGSLAGYDGRHGNSFLRPGMSPHFRSQAVHDQSELRWCRQFRADAVLVSPVWPTRSHFGMPVLGRRGFAKLAAASSAKVVALGGVTAKRFPRLRAQGAAGWAAIDAWLPHEN